MRITMADLRAAGATRNPDGVYLPVNEELMEFILEFLGKIKDAKSTSDIFALAHTLLEVGIHAGFTAGLRHARDLVREVALENGYQIPEEVEK